MSLKVYNTLSRGKEEFAPLDGRRVRMYVCGMTVYDFAHIGHARTYVAFDVIRRYLEHAGYEVTHVQNTTDIDDKILERARELHIPAMELTREYAAYAQEDIGALGVREPHHRPKVTEHIPQIIALVQKLLDKGYAYELQGDVFYDISKFKRYGALSHQSLDELKAGASVEVDARKRNAADFALWKAAKPGEELVYESPWGKGRPGWHIECSAMSMTLLGESIDVHGGATDLIFPHHENEIAQSEAASGKQFVKYWLHTGHLNVKGEKMAKSLKNYVMVRDALKKYDADALRLFFISTHYRQAVDFTEESLAHATNALARIKNALEALGRSAGASTEADARIAEAAKAAMQKFYAAMDDDFNTPAALAVLFELVKDANEAVAAGAGGAALAEAGGAISKICSVFGILQKKAERAVDEKKVNELIAQRNALRKQGKYAEADALREKLRAMGVIIEDYDGRTIWKRR